MDLGTLAVVAAAAATILGWPVAVVGAFVAIRTARSARSAVDLQADQLKLLQQQFAAAQDATRPQLVFELTTPAQTETRGRLAHVHGSEPAYNVKVWVRSSDPDSIRMQNFRVMEPGDHRDVVAEDVPAKIRAEVPGRLLEGTPELLDHWVAVEWEGAHGAAYSVMEIQQRRGGALPRPL